MKLGTLKPHAPNTDPKKPPKRGKREKIERLYNRMSGRHDFYKVWYGKLHGDEPRKTWNVQGFGEHAHAIHIEGVAHPTADDIIAYLEAVTGI